MLCIIVYRQRYMEPVPKAGVNFSAGAGSGVIPPHGLAKPHENCAIRTRFVTVLAVPSQKTPFRNPRNSGPQARGERSEPVQPNTNSHESTVSSHATHTESRMNQLLVPHNLTRTRSNQLLVPHNQTQSRSNQLLVTRNPHRISQEFMVITVSSRAT